MGGFGGHSGPHIAIIAEPTPWLLMIVGSSVLAGTSETRVNFATSVFLQENKEL